MTFASLDVEMLAHSRDSICEIGLVEIVRGRIAARYRQSIRPPSLKSRFPWSPCCPRSILARQPTFAQTRRWLEPILRRAEFVAAHNATFDLNVLANCYRSAGLKMPPLDYVCTYRLAKRLFPLQRFGLADVCAHLGIPLEHHNPLSDAAASAEIIRRAPPEQVRRAIRRYEPSVRERFASGERLELWRRPASRP